MLASAFITNAYMLHVVLFFSPKKQQTDRPGLGAPYSPGGHDKEKPQNKGKKRRHNQISRECILWDYKQGNLVGKYLKDFNRVHVFTDPIHKDCFYESILMSLNPPTFPEVYTGRHLQLQMCMYMVENHTEVAQLLKFHLQSQDISLLEFIHTHFDPKEWGEDCLLLVINKMWNLNITLVNVAQLPLDPIINYSSVEDWDWHYSDIYIIYNGNDHFTGTGAPFLFF